MRKLGYRLAFALLLMGAATQARAWGFYGHRLLNRLAVYTLPPEMFPFFKANIDYITANATRPDSRRSVVAAEAPRHFLDVDAYGDSALTTHGRGLPRRYADAIAMVGGEDSLTRHGIVPWHIVVMKNRLTAAFRAQDADEILRVATDMGHYVADACVPLHTTRNYNGQLTGQRGIHGLWESRLPELKAPDYDLLTGQAVYLKDPTTAAWNAVIRSHRAVDSVFVMERQVTGEFSEDKKFGFEQRGRQNVRTYSRDFSLAYHQRLDGQVERQLRYASRLIGSFWYTCWVDAGQPDLSKLRQQPSEAEKKRLDTEEKELNNAPAKVIPGHDD